MLTGAKTRPVFVTVCLSLAVVQLASLTALLGSWIRTDDSVAERVPLIVNLLALVTTSLLFPPLSYLVVQVYLSSASLPDCCGRFMWFVGFAPFHVIATIVSVLATSFAAASAQDYGTTTTSLAGTACLVNLQLLCFLVQPLHGYALSVRRNAEYIELV